VTPFLTAEQVEAWRNLNFSMPFQLRGRGRTRLEVQVEKLPGDNFATVADSHGNHIFGAIVALQDSRSPWLQFEGDERPWALQFTNKQMPNQKGICMICTGWTKKSAEGGRSIYLYDGNYEIWSCTKIVKKIMSDYFGMVFEHLSSDLNNSERTNFVRAETGKYFGEIDKKIIEISKNSGESVGNILLDSEKVGVVSVAQNPKSFGVYRATISFDTEIPTEDRVNIENAIWRMLCPMGKSVYADDEVGNGVNISASTKPEGFKKGGKKFKGKKQFQRA